MIALVDTTIVSTKVDRGHFGTSPATERQRAQATLSHRGREGADRGTDASTRRFGRPRSASARCKCQPSVYLAAALSARTAGTQGGRDARPVAGSRDRRDTDGRIPRNAQLPLRHVHVRMSVTPATIQIRVPAGNADDSIGDGRCAATLHRWLSERRNFQFSCAFSSCCKKSRVEWPCERGSFLPAGSPPA